MYDLVIVGSGPAGLSAAVYAKRAGLNMIIIEKNPVSGGQIIDTYEVDNYLGIPGVNGFDLGMKFREHADKLGAEFVDGVVTGIECVSEGSDTKAPVFKVVTEDSSYETHTVLLATGAHHSKLGIPGEEEYIGKGVSYCATCDGAFYKKKDVAVNGGGNTALEDALFLSNYCNKVYIIHRRDEFRGEPDSLEALKSKENVELVLNSTIDEIKGDTALEAVVVKNKETGELREIPVAGLFIAIGQEPDNKDFEDVALLDKAGYIDAGEDCKTKTPGVFVAGDCRTKSVRQLTTAASDGAVAALAACAYISSKK